MSSYGFGDQNAEIGEIIGNSVLDARDADNLWIDRAAVRRLVYMRVFGKHMGSRLILEGTDQMVERVELAMRSAVAYQVNTWISQQRVDFKDFEGMSGEEMYKYLSNLPDYTGIISFMESNGDEQVKRTYFAGDVQKHQYPSVAEGYLGRESNRRKARIAVSRLTDYMESLGMSDSDTIAGFGS